MGRSAQHINMHGQAEHAIHIGTYQPRHKQRLERVDRLPFGLCLWIVLLLLALAIRLCLRSLARNLQECARSRKVKAHYTTLALVYPLRTQLLVGLGRHIRGHIRILLAQQIHIRAQTRYVGKLALGRLHIRRRQVAEWRPR